MRLDDNDAESPNEDLVLKSDLKSKLACKALKQKILGPIEEEKVGAEMSSEDELDSIEREYGRLKIDDAQEPVNEL